jgi:hypothetical protein
MLSSVLLAACGDPIKEAQRVEELRVLGARLTVDDEPERATPEPGETARIEWLLADPSGLSPLATWSMKVCLAEDSSYGVPFCRGAELASAEQAELSDVLPTLTFQVPSSEELDSATRLLAAAVFCDGGVPEFNGDIETATCAGANTVQRASFDIFVVQGDAHNQNPTLGSASLEFAGDVWDPVAADLNCSDGALPRVSAGSGEHTIALTLPESAREFEERELDDIDLESLQISHLATLGLLDRRFSSIAPEDSNFVVTVPWQAPGSISEPTPASFYFVVRDSRGGTSWLTRSLCVEP